MLLVQYQEAQKFEFFNPEDVNKEDTTTSGWIPMNWYCATGNLKMCQYLRSRHGADCQKTDTKGWFPQYAAAFNGHVEIVQKNSLVVGGIANTPCQKRHELLVCYQRVVTRASTRQLVEVATTTNKQQILGRYDEGVSVNQTQRYHRG